jgi:hypothetical protein
MKSLQLALLLAASSRPLAACSEGQTQAVAVHHPSAAEYDLRALQEEQKAAENQQKYNPNARKIEAHCRARGFDCWSSEVNPTQEWQDRADAHRKEAATFRGLSQALRDAEAQECAGLDPEDRDTSPFLDLADITNIEPLYVESHRTGTAFTFRVAKGMTFDWFQKVIRCQLARNDAMGHDVPTLDADPLVPANVSVTLKARSVGFIVEVTSGEPTTVIEIVRRTAILEERRAALTPSP